MVIVRSSEGRFGLCWDVNGDCYWLWRSIISGEVGGGEMKCESIFLDAYHWSLMCSLWCGRGPISVNNILGLDDTVVIKSLVHDQVVKCGVY